MMTTPTRDYDRKSVFMKGQLKLSAYMNGSLLTVHVIQGRHMTSTWQRHPNTFVMISMTPEDLNITPIRCRTATSKGTSAPVYNEKFSFEVNEDDANKRLLVSVCHKESATSIYESMGSTSFGVRHLLRGEREVHGWYYLLTDEVGQKKHLQVLSKEQRMRTENHFRIPSVNRNIAGLDQLTLTVHRSRNGGFGFTLVDACPARVGHVDLGSHADTAGLLQEDVVIRVNGQNVSRSTSVSVAKCIKKSGSMVCLEIHRPHQMAPPTIQLPIMPLRLDTPTKTMKANIADDKLDNSVLIKKDKPAKEESYSVQEFTICDDRAALLDSVCSVDTRRQAALHRLVCLEENYVDLMTSGIHQFSRPLRHCILTPTQHSTLFQNIEKLVCLSEYQVSQMIANLPSQSMSDDDTDTSLMSDDLTNAVAMIYMSKLPMLCQSYILYARGLTTTSTLMADLEQDPEFQQFLAKVHTHYHRQQMCDFLNQPLQHVRELHGILQVIQDSMSPSTDVYTMYTSVVNGLQDCINSIRATQPITSMLTSSGQANRVVPLMGSLVLKRAVSIHSVTSSGFGSGSQHSDDHGSQHSDDRGSQHSDDHGFQHSDDHGSQPLDNDGSQHSDNHPASSSDKLARFLDSVRVDMDSDTDSARHSLS